MAIAVLDVGKSSIKVSVLSAAGQQLGSAEIVNRPTQGEIYLVPDTTLIWNFLIDTLRDSEHAADIHDIVVSTHGSSGFLINRDRSTTPLPDYDALLPDGIDDLYASSADSFEERGCGISLGAGHLAKQMVWISTLHTEILDAAEKLLFGPQYWAWRLCGVPSMELTSLSAQSHLWSVHNGKFASIVERFGWSHLMSEIRQAGDVLGTLLPELARQTGLGSDTRIRCGVHDSTANFYRFEAAGFQDFTLLSSGTWLVTLSDLPLTRTGSDHDVNSHVSAANARMWSVRAMAGREFDILSRRHRGEIDIDDVNRVIEDQILAIPSFVPRDGLVPGSAGKGRILGNEPETEGGRAALALVYYAMLADLSLDFFEDRGPIIVDGNITAQPILGEILSAIRTNRTVYFSESNKGTTFGAALLADIKTVSKPALARQTPKAINIDALQRYRLAWRSHINSNQQGTMS